MTNSTKRVTVDLYIDPVGYSESTQVPLDTLPPPGAIGIVCTLGSSRSPSDFIWVEVRELLHKEKPWLPVVDVDDEGLVANVPLQYEHGVDIDMVELDRLRAGQVISFVYDANTEDA